MTPVTCFKGRCVALFGLGGSGLATAQALIAGGCEVVAWDEAPASREKAAQAGIVVADLKAADWSIFDALVLSPGVPLTHPAPHWSVERAKRAGIEIMGDIELFCRERAVMALDSPLIAITGTNGKSTTTALIAHLLETAGFNAAMGGNIGIPILALDPPSRDRWHVIECSSFQIDLAPGLNPSVGVLLNLTPDHIDRHGSMEHYASIKQRLIDGSASAVVGTDDDYCRQIAAHYKRSGRPLTCVSVTERTADLLSLDGTIMRNGEKIADLSGIATLRGAHNAQNAMAAIAAVNAAGLSNDQLQHGLNSFAGLPHRMEQVGASGPVLFINDSKATNADAAEKALAAFPDGIFWIAGGKAKESGITPLEPYFPRIAKAYLVGEAATDFALTLKDRVAFERSGTIDVALRSACADARASGFGQPVVLLSPACASYDQFSNFEVRGSHFRDLVQDLLRVRQD